MKDDKLWKVFSQFIRLRDADENGYCRCFTCGKVVHWKECHAGHGIPRQFKAVKYNEMNVHAQCVSCNTFQQGRQKRFGDKLNYLYGEETWNRLEIASRQQLKLSQFEIDEMEKYYKKEVKKLMKEKLSGI